MKWRCGKATLCVIGGFVVVFLLIVTSPNLGRAPSDPALNSPNPSDAWDPNEDFYYADYVYTGIMYNLDVSASDANDYYQVYVSPNYRLAVNINWSTFADLDLYLYDDNYNQIDSSNSGSNWYENVSYTVTSSGTYYIRVAYYSGSGTIPYTMSVSTTEYVNPFNPALFASIFIPIIVVVIVVIIIAAAVHQYNKQKVIHPAAVGPARPFQPAPQQRVTYSPQPGSYNPSYSPSYAPLLNQTPAMNAAPQQPEAKGLICHSCGAKLEPGQRFCQNCGVDLTA